MLLVFQGRHMLPNPSNNICRNEKSMLWFGKPENHLDPTYYWPRHKFSCPVKVSMQVWFNSVNQFSRSCRLTKFATDTTEVISTYRYNFAAGDTIINTLFWHIYIGQCFLYIQHNSI